MEKIKPLTAVETVEKIEVESLDYKSLNKEELVELIKSKDKAIENYEHSIETKNKRQEDEIKDMNNYYAERIKELKQLIAYHERKENILKGILNIEGGEM